MSHAPSTVERSAEPGRYIGRRVLRPGDQALLRGEATYVANLHPDGGLHAAIVRSPFPHALIESIDVAEARSSPGVKLVATGRECTARIRSCTRSSGPDINSPDRPLLAVDKATFAGEAVAVVVAESRYLAEDAAALVDVDYRPLEPVLDPLTAVADRSPLVHETVSRNCYARRQVEFGDVEAALAAADVIIERESSTPGSRAPQWNAGRFAAPHGKGMTVWLSAQNPHAVHTAIVRVLGIDESELNVIVPEVGGGFGLKGHVYPEDFSYRGSR